VLGRFRSKTKLIRVGDVWGTIQSLPKVVLDILPAFVPYGTVLAAFVGFVIWNGGIVLGKIKTRA